MSDLIPNYVNLNTFESSFNSAGKKIKRLDYYYANRMYYFKYDHYENDHYIKAQKITQQAVKNMCLYKFALEYKVNAKGGVRQQTANEKSKLYPHIQPNLDFFKDPDHEKYWLFCKNNCIKYMFWEGCPTKIIVNEDLDFAERIKLYFSEEIEEKISKKKQKCAREIAALATKTRAQTPPRIKQKQEEHVNKNRNKPYRSRSQTSRFTKPQNLQQEKYANEIQNMS